MTWYIDLGILVTAVGIHFRALIGRLDSRVCESITRRRPESSWECIAWQDECSSTYDILVLTAVSGSECHVEVSGSGGGGGVVMPMELVHAILSGWWDVMPA